MQFRLRNLLVILALAPPFLAWLVWQYNLSATDLIGRLAQLILYLSPLLVIGFFELRRKLRQETSSKRAMPQRTKRRVAKESPTAEAAPVDAE